MAEALPGLVRGTMDRQVLGEGLEYIWRVVRAANGYIDRQAPWALKKTDPARMEAVLRVLLDALQVVGTLLAPYMPDSMGRLLDQLGVPEDGRSIAGLAALLPAGGMLPAPQGIFPRFAAKLPAAV
jgi:methionyl-tRNA synthetase